MYVFVDTSSLHNGEPYGYYLELTGGRTVEQFAETALPGHVLYAYADELFGERTEWTGN